MKCLARCHPQGQCHKKHCKMCLRPSRCHCTLRFGPLLSLSGGCFLWLWDSLLRFNWLELHKHGTVCLPAPHPGEIKQKLPVDSFCMGIALCPFYPSIPHGTQSRTTTKARSQDNIRNASIPHPPSTVGTSVVLFSLHVGWTDLGPVTSYKDPRGAWQRSALQFITISASLCLLSQQGGRDAAPFGTVSLRGHWASFSSSMNIQADEHLPLADGAFHLPKGESFR